MSAFEIIPAANLPADAKRVAEKNELEPGAFYVCWRNDDGSLSVEWHGVDTSRDARIVAELLERNDALTDERIAELYA